MSTKSYNRATSYDKTKRERNNFYETPVVGVERFLSKEKFCGTVWNPACGRGPISEGLKRRGVKVVSTDLVDRGYGKGGVDFLTIEPRFDFDAIATNPPFRVVVGGKFRDGVLAFAERALSFQPRKVALLGRLSWLEGRTRREFFETSGLTRVLIYSGRINVSREGKDYGDGGEGGMVAFAWYVWVRGHKGRPEVLFI